MASEDPSSLEARPVGPPALLGLRPRFMTRAIATAQDDDRIRALSLSGSLARDTADDWSGVEFVVSVADDVTEDVVDELSRKDNYYGQSLVTLTMPQKGVDGGSFVSVTYLQSGLPLRVDWYVVPLSYGLPYGGTKLLYTREVLPRSTMPFAQLLSERPSRQSFPPPEEDLHAATIPIQIKEVARGNKEAVSVKGKPAEDRIEAYEALGWEIAALTGGYADARPPYFNYLGIARQLGR